jgi:predicted alpha/beta superfamily hydrolase
LQPDKLFDRHFAISPSIWANYYELEKLEANYVKNKKTLKANVTLYAGGLEFLNIVSHKIADKVSLLDEKIRELIAVRTLLLNGVKRCQDGCSPEQPENNCPIMVSDKFTA